MSPKQTRSPWPMAVTYSRIFLTPVVMLILQSDFPHSDYIAAALFIFASSTDWLDGFLARILKSESNMGRFMDPVADKILVLGCLLILMVLDRASPWPVAILVGRDIYIGGLRSVAAANKIVISAKPLGKLKTVFQMLSLTCLFIYRDLFGVPFADLGTWLLWAAVGLSLLSGAEYVWGYRKNL